MQKFIVQQFNDTEILFSVQDVNTSAILKSEKKNSKVKSQKGVKAQETSMSKKLVENVNDVREQIKNLIIGFGSDMNSIKEKMQAKAIEMEFSLALSAEGKLIVGLKAEGTLSLKITWEKDSK